MDRVTLNRPRITVVDMCGRYYRRSDKQRIAEAFHLGRIGKHVFPDTATQAGSVNGGGSSLTYRDLAAYSVRADFVVAMR
jgi:hypothetical protein